MKELNFEKAVKRYNDIMMSLCYEHVTIGTRYSEDTKGWNIRDMVAECDYVLSGYYESGHCNADLRYSDDPDERKVWRSETGKLKRFIAAYEPFIEGVICEAGHCSQYDNYKDKFSFERVLKDAQARAASGSEGGKSMMAKEEIINAFLEHRDDTIFVVDPEGEYVSVADTLSGAIERSSNGAHGEIKENEFDKE